MVGDARCDLVGEPKPPLVVGAAGARPQDDLEQGEGVEAEGEAGVGSKPLGAGGPGPPPSRKFPRRAGRPGHGDDPSLPVGAPPEPYPAASPTTRSASPIGRPCLYALTIVWAGVT